MPVFPISSDFLLNEIFVVANSEYEEKGTAHHHKSSSDDFYTKGLPEIITRVFVIDKWINNRRDKTEEDKKIKNIHCQVFFSNVNLKKPTTVRYYAGDPIHLYPISAIRENKTYSGNLYVDAKIVATAYYIDGSAPKVREQEITNLHIAAMPIIVGSKLCHTYKKSKEALIQMQEDPTDPGGYVPIKGIEWVVDNIESILFNQIRCFRNLGHQKEMARGEIVSKPGDSYENSIETIIRILNDNKLTIQIVRSEVQDVQFPFYLVFRALGWYSDKQIVESITYGGDDQISRRVEEILESGFKANYSKELKHKRNLGGGDHIYKQDEVLAFIAKNLPTDTYSSYLDVNNEDELHQIINKLQHIFDNFLLPHIGTDESSRQRKLRFLGHIINRMILVHLGEISETDRDSYLTKRIHSTGPSCAKTLKTHFNAAVVIQIRKRFAKDFKALSFSDVNLGNSLQAAIQGMEFERLITQAITAGTRSTLKLSRQKVIINRLTTQTLNRKNQLASISTLRMINSPNADTAAKISARAAEMRQVHMTLVGYGCLVQSPDSGEKVGLHKQMTLTASICLAASSATLKEQLLDDPEMIPLDKVSSTDIYFKQLCKVFVNGSWIGCVEKSYVMRWKYIKLRRLGKAINPMATIQWDIKSDELYFWVDVGRVTRPLLIVYNTHRDADTIGLVKPSTQGIYKGETGVRPSHSSIKKIKFEQGLKLTKNHIKGLMNKTITVEDLQRDGIIEYITPSEQQSLYICPNITILAEQKNNILQEYTHCDIPEALMGIPAMTGPLANHNQTPRNAFQTSQVKQACGWYALNWQYRIDKETFFQYKCEYPLVKTKANNYIFPNGMNAIVAIACYTGFNEEDSIICNKASIDRQMFCGSILDYVKSELEKSEEFGLIDFENTKDVRANASAYSKLDANGFISTGMIVEAGDVLISKRRKLSKAQAQEDEKLYSDQSLIYTEKTPSIISNVIRTKNSDDIEIVKVALRKVRYPAIGDKFSLRPSCEVLTDSGWVSFNDVTLDCKIASLRDGKIEYIKPSGKSVYDHDGSMYYLKTQQIYTMCTLNHRMYVKRRNRNEFEFIRARDMMGKRVRFKKDGVIETPDIEELTFTVDGNEIKYDTNWFLQLLGMFIADGCISKKKYIIILAATKQRKIAYHEAICENLKLEYEYHDDRFFKGTYINDENMYNIFKPWSVGALNKSLPNFVWNLNTNQARVLLNALIAGDGSHNNEGSVCYYTSSSSLANDIQRLALHAGWSGCIKLIRPSGTKALFGDGHVHQQKIQEEKLVQYKGEVVCLEVPETHLMYCRETRFSPPSWTGNSARSGQKAIVGLKLRESDMPFAMNGMIPDIILNPHCKPSRMTIGQLEECGLALVGACQGRLIDATIFTPVDIGNIQDILEASGLNRHGNMRLFSGITGEWIDTMIFTGPTYYQRLQKFGSKQVYAITSGPTDMITRQPLDGKASKGGIRAGEMEKDVFMAHGASGFALHKMRDHSDKYKVYVCRLCGEFALVNLVTMDFKCKNCGDLADIAEITTTWSSKTMLQMLNSMNIGTKFGLKPYIFHKDL